MSRLDYLTIAIVGACILAIIFLVFKMTDLFKGDNPEDKIEVASDSIESEDDGIYDYEIDETVDSTGTGANAASDNTTTTGSAAPSSTTTTTTSIEQDASSSEAEDDEAVRRNFGGNYTHPGGAYMVIAGAFTQRALAQQEVNRMKKKGYSTAGLEIFDRGKYAVVLVDQFNSIAAADELVEKLRVEGVKAYVKKKESQ